MGLDKSGMYHAMDALLASLLLLGVAVFLLQTPFYENAVEQKSFITEDMLSILSELKVAEINDPFIAQEIANGNITNTQNSILEQMGEYWALNSSDKATTLFDLVFNNTIPNITSSIQINIEDDVIYELNNSAPTDIITGRRMISGIAQNSPLSGFSSSAYLKRIQNKKSNSYYYFGGFIGQGNLTFFIDNLPADIDSSRIDEIKIEGDFGSDFNLFINNDSCTPSTDFKFTVTSSLLSVDSWDITHCNASFATGRNDFEMNFLGLLNESFTAGGLIKISYRTDELQDFDTSGFRQYFFPGISGVPNVYDSFYVPGELDSLDVYLHYNSSTETFLSIGERIIELEPNATEQKVSISSTELLTTYGFDYDQLSLNTIPIRFASYNTTTDVIESGDADIVLITDFSGSMKNAISDWSQGNLGANCADAISDPTTRRTNLAKCLDEEFIDSVMNYTGNRIWPVFIHNDEIKWYNNPEDAAAIKGYVNSYPNGKGKTCLSCALNQAYDIFDTYSNESRTKFVVLMTDGVPTHCADGNCTSTSAEFGTKYCEGLCDTAGACDYADVISECSVCIANPGPAQNMNFSASRLFDDLNATIFTVGFGPVDDCSLADQVLTDVASIGNGTYQKSNDSTELQLIYENISTEVLNRVDQVNQTVTVQGNYAPATLYGDSHINFTYTDTISLPPSSLTIVFEEELNSCTPTVTIPPGIALIEATVTSYSGSSWSDMVVTNSNTSFNLSDYFVPYYRLGDPFLINIPIEQLHIGANNLFIETGSSPTNRTGCSLDNSFIYAVSVPSVTSRTDVLEVIEGCLWTVHFEDGDVGTVSVPTSYNGSNTCSYQPGNISYNVDDTYDVAAYNLFEQLDTDNDGEVLVNINKFDLEISTTTVSDIPYLWGPSMVTLNVWD